MINRCSWCLTALLLTGCGSTSLLSTAQAKPPMGTQESTQLPEEDACQCSPTSSNSTRALLNPGYAQLATILNGLAWTDEILLIKLESDEVEAVGDALAEMASDFLEELDALAEADKQMLLDNDGFPTIEKRKQQAMLKQWM